jgi:hypothetical protein
MFADRWRSSVGIVLLRTKGHGEFHNVSVVGTVSISSSYLTDKEVCYYLLVTANVVPNSPILVTLMMEAISSSETSVLIRIVRLLQKQAFLIVTAVKTSNVTIITLLKFHIS